MQQSGRLMPRTKSSQAWLREHFTDPYVKQSWQDGYRSRAAYKLLEIDKRHRLLRVGLCVIDLGAAPGSWSQVVMQKISPKGRLIALDLLPMAPIEGACILQGDFNDEIVVAHLKKEIGKTPVDLILCDISPNLSGLKTVDQMRMGALSEQVLSFAKETLRQNGTLLIKGFQGVGFDDFLKALKSEFSKITIIKPLASRKRSDEYYLLAEKFKR